MKILFVISSLGIGGEQKAASILTRGFVESGNKVSILCLASREKKSFRFDERIKITFANIQKSASDRHIKRIQAIRQEVSAAKYDIIIAFALYPSLYCSILKPIVKIPIVVSERNDPSVYPWPVKVLRHLVYRNADLAVFQTRAASSYFRFIPESKKIVIPNPINFKDLPKPFVGRRDVRICNTARLVPAKRQIDLIRCFAIVLESHPKAELCIYGDGPLLDDLNKVVAELDIGGSVHFFSATPNVLEEINTCSVFVLSSNNEGFPNSLAEALALGIPSVSTDCRIGGPADMIDDGVNGFLVPVGDIQKMARAVNLILDDAELSSRFSANSKKKSRLYDSETICLTWIESMSNLINFNK